MNGTRWGKERLTLPTYPTGPASLNPIISEYRNEKPYPYRLWDNLEDEKRDVEYEALFVENEYLKLTVLPALGGKLYSALDKRNGEQLFYRNRVVKPQLVGLTGAWTSGGIEFNYPLGHRPSTMEEMETEVRGNSDGSASIFVGEVDRISGIRFSVELCLRPGTSYIEQTVRLFNPTALPQRFFYWNTASYPETDELECRYPARWMIEEWTRERMPWPYDYGQVDVRQSRNIRKFSSIFTSLTDEDYFGVYDAKLGRGNVHVANHREVPGKKFWSWGQSDAGKMWNRVLTDSDGPYMEHQAGNIETQCEYRYLQPYQTHSWKEYWFQAIETGPFTYACKQAMVTTAFSSLDSRTLRLALTLLANEPLADAELVLLHDDHALQNWSGTWTPAAKAEWGADVPSRCLAEGDLRLRLLSADGEVVFDHCIRRSVPVLEAVEEPIPLQPNDDLSTELVKIAKIEERLLYKQALQLYDELLASHPHYVEAHARKVVLLLKTLRTAEAEEAIRVALALTPFSDELHYYAGLVLFIRGRWGEAKQALLNVNDVSMFAAPSNVLLGKIALRLGETFKASQSFAKALTDAARADMAETLLGYSLRRLGSYKRAKATLERVLETDPLNLTARAEYDLLIGGSETDRLVRGEVHNAIVVAQFYDEIGDYAAEERMLRRFPDQQHPLILYHLGRLRELAGEVDEAIGCYTAAEQASPDYVFPMAPLTMEALEAAAARLGTGACRTLYYMGLVCNARERFADAERYWTECLDRGMEYSVVNRNLGFMYMQGGETDRAIAVLEAGMGKQPFNPEIAAYLNALYKSRGETEKRRALVQTEGGADGAALDQTYVRMLIGLYNDMGDYDSALQLLLSYPFRNWEMEYVGGLNLRELYQATCLGLAKRAMADKRWEEAIDRLEQAMHYPENTLLGKRWDTRFTRELYWLGLCREQLGDFAGAIRCYDRIIADPEQADSPDYQDYVKAVQRKVELEWLGFRGNDVGNGGASAAARPTTVVPRA